MVISAWLVSGRVICFAIAGARVEIAQMPHKAASASPISDFAAALALLAFANLVKVLQLECRIAAQLVAIALRTG